MRKTMQRAGQLLAVAAALSAFGFGAREAYAASRSAVGTDCYDIYICFTQGQQACDICCREVHGYAYGECLSGGACVCGT